MSVSLEIVKRKEHLVFGKWSPSSTNAKSIGICARTFPNECNKLEELFKMQPQAPPDLTPDFWSKLPNKFMAKFTHVRNKVFPRITDF